MCKRTLGFALEVFKNHLLAGHASKRPQMLEQEAQWPHCVCPFLVATELDWKLILGNEVTITLMINSRSDQTPSLHRPYFSFQKVKACSCSCSKCWKSFCSLFKSCWGLKLGSLPSTTTGSKITNLEKTYWSIRALSLTHKDWHLQDGITSWAA